jgi:hypothetical protein
MFCSDNQAGATANLPCDEQCSPVYRTDIVDDESDWRVPRQSATAQSVSKIVATRWHAGSERVQEFTAETGAECHVVKIVLRNMNIRFRASSRMVHDGMMTPGTVHAMSRAEEKIFLQQAAAMVEEVTGQRPIGYNANWLCGSALHAPQQRHSSD